VPQISASITGEVNQPGTYAIIPGKTDTLEALIQAAGGPTSKADLKRVRISTTKGAERPTSTVDASDPAVRQSTKIQSGDAVFIPQVEKRRHRISLSEVYQVILIVYTLIQIFGN
jgi:protein involved in polysaccharide export with SLBB domain